MSSFQDLRQKPGQSSSMQAALNYKTEREHALPARNSFGFMPQGYCEQKHLNLEKTPYSVLSVLLLIYGLEHLP